MRRLEHVLWIGGPPGAGKSSVATRICRRHGLRYYGADTRTWRHRDRALRAGSQPAHRWEAMSPDQRWAASTPSELLEMSLHRERGPMVIDDLCSLPDSPMVVAEGTTLPARAFTLGIAQRSHAVWLLPTGEFQHAKLANRTLSPGATALYLLLSETIRREASEHGVRTLTVDGRRSIKETATAVEGLFAEALAHGPRAESPVERQALLREANESIASQVRGYCARPWTNMDAEAVVQEFLCECADPACDASVLVPVRALSSGHIFAPDHR